MRRPQSLLKSTQTGAAPSSSSPQSSRTAPTNFSRRFREWFFASKIVEVALLVLVLLVSGLTFGGIALPFKVIYSRAPAHAVSAAPARPWPAGGIVVRSESFGPNLRLLLRSSPDQNSSLVLTPRTFLIARDGRHLSMSSILSGDVLSIRKNKVMDLSQQSASLTGIVTPVSENPTTVMILKLNPSHSILVDIGRGTRVTGSSRVASGSVILDADRVRVHGVLDAARAELTQVDAIVQLNDWTRPHGNAA